MPLPQNIPINITPENVWAVLDAVESDFEDDLADVMEDSDTEFVVEDEEKDEDQERDTEAAISSNTNQTPHAIVHDLTEGAGDDVLKDDLNEISGSVANAAKNKDDGMKEIHWTKSTKYIQAQKECRHNGEVLLDIDPLDNPLKVFEKLVNLDEFLHHLKVESERYAVHIGRNFEVCY